MSGEKASRGRGAAVWLFFFAALAALAYTWPLVLYFRTAIPYAYAVPAERRVVGLVPGDHLQFYYFLSLSTEAASGRVPWFSDPYEFRVPGAAHPRSFFFLPFSILFLAASPLGGAAAYNLLVWLSFPATALSVYGLGRRLALGGADAAVAAAAAMLLPYRVANVAGGHPTGFVFFLLPLTFYFLERSWQEESRRAAAAGGLCAAALAVNEPHFLYFVALLLPFWLLSVLWRLEPNRRPGEIGRSLAWLALAAIGPAAAALSYAARRGAERWSTGEVVLVYLVVWGLLAAVWRVTAEARARAGDESWSGEAASYSPLVLLAVYPLQVFLDLRFFGRVLIAVATLGVLAGKLPCARACVSLWRRPASGPAASRLRALWPFWVGFAAALALIFQYKSSFIDPSSRVAGRSLREVALFSPVAQDFLRRSNPVLTRQLYPGAAVALLAALAMASRRGRALLLAALCFAALALGPNAPRWFPLFRAAFEVVPFFTLIRQPGKFFALAALALVLAAGAGSAFVRSRLPPRAGTIVIGVALAGMLADFSGVLPFGLSVLPTENRAYAVVAERGRGSNLLELPLWPGDSAFSSIYQYWTSFTKVPTVNGYSPTAPRDYVERVVRPLESMNFGEMSETQKRLLASFEVRLVTLHRDAYPPQVSAYPYRFTLAAMRRNPNLEFLTADGGVYLFEVSQAGYRSWSPRIGTPLGIFYEAEALKLGSGVRVADVSASGGAFVRGQGGRAPVVYGPYRPFPQGRYEVRFRVRGRGAVEVAAELGKRVLSSIAIDSASFDEIPLVFEIEAARSLEFRGWAAAAGALDLDWVLVRKLDPIERISSTRVEAEDLIALSGIEREAEDASGGAYAVVVPSAAAPGSVVRDGPYQIFEAGRIHVAVRARGGAVYVRLETADGRKRFADLGIPPAPSWQVTEAEAVLPERTVLCTRLASTGADAEVDFIEVRPEG